MVGKLHKSWPGGHVYMLVAVDKFTKWIEATPVTTQDSMAAINFISSIVFHFGVPHSIITDNGTNFKSKEFKNYYESMGIKLNFASVAHLQTNRQVKKANGLICSGINSRLLVPLKNPITLGLKSYPPYSRVCEKLPMWQLKKHLSLWSTTQKPFFQ
jgi:hypothetical protein